MSDLKYRTSDIQIAASLLCLQDIEFDSVEPLGQTRRALFVLSGDSVAIDQAVKDYMNDALSVPPRKLLTKVRELKGLASNVRYH